MFPSRARVAVVGPALALALVLGLVVAVSAVAAAAAPTEPAVIMAACGGTLVASTPGTVESDALTEISGIAASRRNPGAYWVHNDSGDTARIFAIDLRGRTLGEFALAGASAVDWEDIAVGPGPQARTSYVYVGDIGDNAGSRPSVVVYRVPEPAVTRHDSSGDASPTPPAPQTLDGVAALTFTYPDGPHDAEALLVDPRRHDLVIVTKDLVGGRGLVFRGRADAAAGSTAALEPVGTVSLGLGRGVTGGDVTATGDAVALRTYLGVVLYPRPARTPLWRAFSQPSCDGAAPPFGALRRSAERQGEAIGFVPSGRGYVTVSEGEHPPLHRFSVPG